MPTLASAQGLDIAMHDTFVDNMPISQVKLLIDDAKFLLSSGSLTGQGIVRDNLELLTKRLADYTRVQVDNFLATKSCSEGKSKR